MSRKMGKVEKGESRTVVGEISSGYIPRFQYLRITNCVYRHVVSAGTMYIPPYGCAACRGFFTAATSDECRAIVSLH